MTRPKSRPTRWAEACAAANKALDAIEESMAAFEEATGELQSIKEEFESWRDNLSENLANSALGQKLSDVCDLEVEDIHTELADAIEAARDKIGDAEAADLPLGFGRD